jgi:hypothetical protein
MFIWFAGKFTAHYEGYMLYMELASKSSYPDDDERHPSCTAMHNHRLVG